MYVNAKMSHKLDAPATLNVVSEGVQMGGRSLKFAASKDHKRFALDLALHADIDPDVREEEDAETETEAERRTTFDNSLCLVCPESTFRVNAFVPYFMSRPPHVLLIRRRARSRSGLLDE